MTERKARSNKILLLGVDGMDPRLTRKYVDEGILPNVKQYIERGAQRHDLVMLGGQAEPGQCQTNVFKPASAVTFHNCSALHKRESML